MSAVAADRELELFEKCCRLPNVRMRSAVKGVASCPCPGHGSGRGDLRPTLNFERAPTGKTLIKCFAGCEFRDIVDALETAFPIHVHGSPAPSASAPPSSAARERKQEIAHHVHRYTRAG